MDWKVNNALSRDIERQQLNKVLADIRTTYTELAKKATTASTGNVTLDALANAVEGNIEEGISVTYDPVKQVLDFIVNNFTIRLTGDVTGEAEVRALGTISLVTTLDPSLVGVEEAPIDNQSYWRKNAEWDPVPDTIFSFMELKDEGFPVLYQDDTTGAYQWVVRVFDVETGELTVADPTGEGGNPTFGLADVPDAGGGELQKTQFDAKGRKTGTSNATTDDLEEGTANLYHTDERAQRASAAPYYIPVGETFVVYEYSQVLFTLPIDMDGGLEINGALIEV